MKSIYLLPHIIHSSAAKYPDKAAFRCNNQSITFAELSKQVNQLAHTLIALGVQPGDRVAAFFNRSLETAIAIYGIMQSGAAYVPIDPNLPPERIQFLINDCDIQHLVTNKMQKSRLKKLMTGGLNIKTILGLEADLPCKTISWENIRQKPANEPDVNILEHDLAYILYTSGSTGTPKGIMHSHYSGLAYAKLTADLYGLNEQDIIGNHAPIFFDISTLGYFTAPFVGATTIISSEAHIKMPASLAQLIAKEKITVWYSVPLALIQMLQNGAIAQRDWSAIRWIFYAGEPFPVKHLRTVMELLPQARFSNIYGPTETNQCTYYNLPGIPKTDDPIPIGYIWGNTEMMIVDENDEEVQDGEVGELLIRSATKMLGYWKKPELTAISQLVKQTSSGIQKQFYKTGDLVKVNSEGLLLFLGRKDRQVKTRGFRVELDEVENALLANPAVSEVAVFTIKEEADVKSIYAIVTLKEEVQLSEAELTIFAKQKLAWYAVPQKIIISQELPRTATGKINRKQLQAKYQHS